MLKQLARKALPAPLFKLARRAYVARRDAPPRRVMTPLRAPSSPDAVQMPALEAALRKTLPADYLGTPAGEADLADHLHRRLDNFRRTIVPWLHSAFSLNGSVILEIGCGTGSSTVALAEQGAIVTAIDVDEEGLEIARLRCKAHGVDDQVRFHCMNATDIARLGSFGCVIFFACLEHMTVQERLKSLTDAWAALYKGHLCVVDTPNRLWHFDGHTALLPFFHWLPDELAFAYAKHSPRESVASAYREPTEERMQHFLRRGRGVSYHEFQLALGDRLNVVSCLDDFLWSRRPLGRLRGGRDPFERELRRSGPPLHRAFYKPSLDLILRRS